MSEAPNYLVQTEDKTLHCYFTLAILLIDLRFHRGEAVTIFERRKCGFKAQYAPVTEAALRERLQNGSAA
jgi:hypothetical protein